MKNIVGFILFDAGSFNLIESSFLVDISEAIPKREKVIIALENLSRNTQK